MAKYPDAPLDSPKRLAIMILPERHASIALADLPPAMGLTKGAVDSHLRKLENHGYLYKERRIVDSAFRLFLYPTAEGLIALQLAKLAWKELLED